MYSAISVAKTVIEYSNKEKYPITNLKLQKLMYFIQADFLVNKGSPCFPEEIEAWDFGPVVPEVYFFYKMNGSSNLTDADTDTYPQINVSDRKRIEAMVDSCAAYSAADLVSITHRQTPWIKVYSPYSRKVITKKSIRDYFSKE